MSKVLESYSDPFDAVREFEVQLQEYTGAPYALVTDSCTHAMEIVLRIDKPKKVTFPSRTYLSVLMIMHKLDIEYELVETDWFDDRFYNFQGSRLWDCARYLEPYMFQTGKVQCLSFNRDKPLPIGKGGAILTDDPELAERANRMRYDGRDIFKYRPWVSQKNFELGFHYYLRPEECIIGLNLLNQGKFKAQSPSLFNYPDCRQVNIVNDIS